MLQNREKVPAIRGIRLSISFYVERLLQGSFLGRVIGIEADDDHVEAFPGSNFNISNGPTSPFISSGQSMVQR